MLLVAVCTSHGMLGSHIRTGLLLTPLSMLLETGIFLSQAIWLWRVRHIREEAKKAGKTYDEYVTENPSKKILRCESSETVVDAEACHEPVSQNTMSEQAGTGSEEKKDKASEGGIAVARTAAAKYDLRQKWRELVLRPNPDVQS